MQPISSIRQVSLQQVVEKFWETIPSTWHTIRANNREIAAQRFAITVEQFHILRQVGKGINSVSEIAEAKFISQSAISQAVETLVQRGLLTRQPDANDRRIVRLQLTEAGRSLLDNVFEENRRWLELRFEGLAQAELAAIDQALDVFYRLIIQDARA